MLTIEKRREIERNIKEKSERAFDVVREELLSGALLTKIQASGTCEYVFEKLGTTVLQAKRRCERENGHTGAHMFGLSVNQLRPEDS